MSRNRVIYQSLGLLVGPTPATGVQATVDINQLYRVQSADYDFQINRQDINEFGTLAALSREIIDAPTANISFSYYLTNVLNEQALGFVVDGSSSMISGLLDKSSDEKNYYLVVSPEGTDANDNTTVTPGQEFTVGIGNGFISSYSVEAAVGGIPTVTVQVEALNVRTDTTTSGFATPAVDPTLGIPIVGSGTTVILPPLTSGLAGQITALRPGDVNLNLNSAPIGVSDVDLKVQRAQMEVRLTRESLNKLGSRFAFSKEIRFPVNATLRVDAQIGDLKSGAMSDVLCNDVEYDLVLSFRKPSCSGQGDVAVQYTLKKAKLDSSNFTNRIGSNSAVSLQFTAPIGGPSDQIHGLFLSGILT